MALTGLERWLLRRFCQKYGIDEQEIDDTLTHKENLEHLETFVIGITGDEIQQYVKMMNEIMAKQPLGTFSNVEPIDIEIQSFDPLFKRDVGDIDGLIATMIQDGLITPLLVRPSHKEEGKYDLVIGYRRFVAAKTIGSPTIPCILRDMNNEKTFELSAIENTKRKDWNPIEEARHYQGWMGEGVTEEYIGERLGKVGKKRSQEYVSNKIRLLKLPEEVQGYIIQGKLTPTHGIELLAILEDKPKLQIHMAVEAIVNKWSTLKLRNEIKKEITLPSEFGKKMVFPLCFDYMTEIAKIYKNRQEACNGCHHMDVCIKVVKEVDESSK